MIDQEKIEKLSKTAKELVAPGKGILAADESMNTVGKRFAPINLENNEDNRRAFRHMLLTAPGESEFISGVILFDETIRQNDLSGKSFVSVMQEGGIIPGIKVDQGLADFGDRGEKTTKGLEGLSDRLKEYVSLGARFAKWRSVITISNATSPSLPSEGEELPSDGNILQNAKDLAAYALVCQQEGLVPIVEPEVLLDGNHSLQQAKDASTKILTALFNELNNAGVVLEALLLKTSMVLPGKDFGQKASAEEIAKNTLEVFNATVPHNLAGIIFLSGGQGDVEATENLNAINSQGTQPWPLTFSYARALQDAATKTWAGKPENMDQAQQVFLHRAKMNSLATFGKYTKALEEGFATASGGQASQD
ncbi:MAG: fructose-bisphosphate aldolase class I [Candidatus Doudnabacteria bacterium]|nr:fructose-bisphosphate aldolase class I [Candidatus Doudnabacteria bacterium]